MYTKSTKQIGQFEEITYTNAKTGNSLSIIPKAGANINKLVFNGTNVISGPETLAAILGNDYYESTFLAPFANRIDEGKYTFEGKEYQLPINEKGLNNALHGFMFNRKFYMPEEQINEESVSLTLHYKHNGLYQGFPFPFECYIKIQFSDADGLTIDMSFKNLGDNNMPLSYGWHPYMTLGVPVDQMTVQTEEVDMYTLSNRNLPTGASEPFTKFNTPNPVGDLFLDSCFQLKNPPAIANTILADPASGKTITVWQETGKEKYNIVQLFTPPSRKCIAVEPMTGGINAFNTGVGLISLAPGATTGGKFGVKYSQK